jgi:hypothetical protein
MRMTEILRRNSGTTKTTTNETFEFQSSLVSDTTPIPLLNNSNQVIYKQLKGKRLGEGISHLFEDESTTRTPTLDDDETESFLPVSGYNESAIGLSHIASSSYYTGQEQDWTTTTVEDAKEQPTGTSLSNIQNNDDLEEEETPPWSSLMERLANLDLERVKQRINEQKSINVSEEEAYEDRTTGISEYTADFHDEEEVVFAIFGGVKVNEL